MSRTAPRPRHRGPTIREIAEIAGVGPATVDRVLNQRPGVRPQTRRIVLDALDKLSRESRSHQPMLDVRIFCESGEAFNLSLQAAEAAANRTLPSVALAGRYGRTSDVDPAAFAAEMEQCGATADGVIVVAREHPAINRAIRRLCRKGIPVICMTTDLPSSRRTAYVGSDAYAAGGVAGHLIGTALATRDGRILFIASAPFRSQQEREMGFRRALRAEFPHLRIDDRVISDDVPEHTCAQLLRYFETHGLPDAIYNAAGGNRGVAQALDAAGRPPGHVFVGHELTRHSRHLLEQGVMDYVISHDVAGELRSAVACIRDARAGTAPVSAASAILVHTRYNCA